MNTRNYTLWAMLLLAILSGCTKKEDLSLKLNSPVSITLNYEQESQIKATSAKSINYSCDNLYHAAVSSKGLITARFVGETSIKLSNGQQSKTVRVVVEPRYNLYQTPSIQWGTTRSQIKSRYGSPDSETATGLGYNNYSTAAPVALFVFNERTDRLEASAVLVKHSYTSTLTNFLIERYLVVDVSSSNVIATMVNGLSSSTMTTIIGLSYYNSTYSMVTYSDSQTTSYQEKSANKTANKRLQELAESLL